ncbi:MAG: sensor histidine kinase [Streptomyces sp.]|nr:sensor histidine kinase [Streptomyces sp.]
MSQYPGVREQPTPRAAVDVMGGLVGALLVTAATVLTAGREQVPPQLRALDATAYLLVAMGGAALALRHLAPLWTFTLTLLPGIAYQAAGYPGGPAPAPIILALYSMAARGERQRVLGLGLVATAALTATRALSVPHGPGSPLLVAFPTAIVAALYSGQIVANRRARVREAAERAALAEREREQETKRRIDAERLRIAREFHDVVAHNISLINVQATMGVHLMDQRPTEAGAALAAIKDVSRQTLRELRRIVDVLRQSDEAEPTAPAPGLAGLDALVAGTRHAGLPVELHVLGRPRPLPPTVDVAAFRIIQESLTNALRYSDAAPTRVTLTYRADALVVEVVDDGRGAAKAASGSAPPVSGHGIAGMRERANAVGGTLDAGPVDGGGFAVRADLPLTTVLP